MAVGTRTRGSLRRGSLAALLALAATVVLAAPARADYDPVGSGATRLTLDRGFVELMAKAGVKLQAVPPAKLEKRTVIFPVDGGKFDPVAAQGTVEHEGALLLRAGKRKIPLKRLKLRTTQTNSPFSAKAGGSQLKIATARGVDARREGFGEVVRVSGLALGAKLATRLGKKLDRRTVFKAGTPIGSATTFAAPATVALLGQGNATFSFAPGFAAKLESLFVAANPIFPAEHVGSTFTLPIFGGDIAPDVGSGLLETSGAIEFLQLGGGQVFWHEPRIDLASRDLAAELDLEPSPPYQGKIGRVAVAALAPTFSAAADATSRTVTVTGAGLALDPTTAAAFNELFARPQGKDGVFLPGESLGTVSFSAHGK